MNIEQYRAMVAEEAQKAQEQQQLDSQRREEQTDVQAQQTPATNEDTGVQTTAQTQSTPNQDGAENTPQDKPVETTQTAPQTIEIDGQEVSIDELKSGYLRQSDYTKKTQELAKMRRDAEIASDYYKAITSNPELAKQLSEQHNLPYMTPEQAQIKELNDKYNDLLLEREVDRLQTKYTDFDVKEVLQFAYDRKMENLEDAYFLHKSRKEQAQAPQAQPAQAVDVDAIKEQIRQEIMQELQSSQVDTKSIIQTRDLAQVKDTTPTLSERELKIARGMKLTPEEYAKWRDKR